jgi:hypothetical protein
MKTSQAIATITCFDCQATIEAADGIKVQVEALRAGWARKQRKGDNGMGWEWICGADGGIRSPGESCAVLNVGQ